MNCYDKHVGVSGMIGKTITKIDQDDEYELVFTLDDGSMYRMCPEDSGIVYLEDIAGDLEDLVGSPLPMSEEVSNAEDADFEYDKGCDCEEWTFYKFATINGYVTLRWYGNSYGYYSTRVSFIRIKEPNERKLKAIEIAGVYRGTARCGNCDGDEAEYDKYLDIILNDNNDTRIRLCKKCLLELLGTVRLSIPLM